MIKCSSLSWEKSAKLACQASLVGALGAVAAIGSAFPAAAAERIVVSYGLLELAVSISSLETYAQTGELEDDLAAFSQYIDPKYLERLRPLLSTRINLTSANLSQLLYSSFGESSLKYLGQAIQTESRLNGFYSIRAALLLAAADPGGLTLLGAIKQFPTPTLRIDSIVALKMVGAFIDLADLTDRMVALVEQRSAAEAQTQSAIDPAADLSQPGALLWQQQTLVFEDQTRHRTLTSDLYLPRLAQPAPVLVISHGLAADRSNFAYLARHLASHGFAVTVIEHPGSDRRYLRDHLAGAASEVVPANEFIDRPLDISHLLDQLTQLNQSNSALAGRLNLEQVGMIGHSFGGYTALALAGAQPNLALLRQVCPNNRIDLNAANLSLLLQCAVLELPDETDWNLQDPRIRAIFAMHPFSSTVFGQSGLRPVQIPVMLVAGSRDMIAPAVLEQVCPFTWLTGADQYLALIEQGGHSYGAEANSVLPLPLEATGLSPALARSYIKAMSLAFANSHIKNQPEYEMYLSAAHAKSISRAPLSLKIIQKLTQSDLFVDLKLICPGVESPLSSEH